METLKGPCKKCVPRKQCRVSFRVCSGEDLGFRVIKDSIIAEVQKQRLCRRASHARSIRACLGVEVFSAQFAWSGLGM